MRNIFKITVTLIVLSTLLFVQGCSPRSTKKLAQHKQYEELSLNKDERCILEKFFRYFFLRNSGIFSLLGTKPITYIQINYRETEEEEEKLWNSLSEEEKLNRTVILNRDDPHDMAIYKSYTKEQRKNMILVDDIDFIFEGATFLKRWNVVEKIPVSNKYLLIRKDYDTYANITVVNVLETAYVLQKHYDAFKSVVSFDFDPLSVVLELKEKESTFWDALEKANNSFLWGLLYGFGEKNAYCFYWKYDKENIFFDTARSYCTNENIVSPTIKNFSIPTFVSFFDHDPIIEKYRREKKQIQDNYEGKNFLDHTIKILMDK